MIDQTDLSRKDSAVLKMIGKTWNKIEWRRREIDGEGYILGKQLWRELRVTPVHGSRILNDDRGTVHLGGAKPISVRKQNGRRAGVNVWILEDHAKSIFESFRHRQLLRAGKKTDNGYLGRKATLALGINEPMLKRLVDAGLVGTKKIPNTLGRGREKTGFKKANVLSYLAKRSQEFDGVYADGRVNLTKAAKDSGLPRGFLDKCTSKGECYYRNDGQLPSLMQRPPIGSRRSRAEITVFPEDVDELKRAIAEAHHQALPGKGWEDVQDLATRYKVHVGLLGPILCELRRTKPDAAIRIWWNRRGQWRRVWLYNVENVNRVMMRVGGDGAATPIAPAATVRDQRSLGGRPRDPETEALYKFCYEGHTSGEKATVTKVRANQHFKSEVIPDARWVLIYAKRYAKRHTLPL